MTEEKEKEINEKVIKISKVTQMSLDNLRREIVEIISNANDLDLMKKVEKCSYDKLILLLNVGFSEKAFYDTLGGKTNLVVEQVDFTEKSKEVLLQLLKEEKEDKIEKKEETKQTGGLQNDK
jgi:hypothetical protein